MFDNTQELLRVKNTQSKHRNCYWHSTRTNLERRLILGKYFVRSMLHLRIVLVKLLPYMQSWLRYHMLHNMRY